MTMDSLARLLAGEYWAGKMRMRIGGEWNMNGYDDARLPRIIKAWLNKIPIPGTC